MEEDVSLQIGCTLMGPGCISCAQGGCIYIFGSFNVCDNTNIYDIIKVEKKEKDTSPP